MKPLLCVTHVPWEGPHRILDAFAGVPVVSARPLDGDALPAADDVRGAVVMGGPMGANDAALDVEVTWLRDAVSAGVPVLGVCLGSQLLARALGAEVRGGESEIGWAPVDVAADDDPLLGPLAPSATVLHWHGEVFDLPEGAESLASSARTACQAFRFGPHAWGTLFHAEADAELVGAWLREPVMLAELDAQATSDGPAGTPASGAAAALRAETQRHAPALAPHAAATFRAFAEVCAR